MPQGRECKDRTDTCRRENARESQLLQREDKVAAQGRKSEIENIKQEGQG